MTTEQALTLITAITGLAGVALAGFGMWLGYRAPSMGLQEALHVKQIEGATALLESVSQVHKQLASLAVSRGEFQSLSEKLQVSDNESDLLLVVLFDTMMEVQRYRGILPAAVIDAHHHYLTAAAREGGDSRQAPATLEAYLSLIAAIRRELGVDPLSERTVTLMRGGSKPGSLLPW